MSLSTIAKHWLSVSIANVEIAEEIAAAIDSQGSGPATFVATVGTLSPVAVTFTGAACSGGSTPTATNVNTAIDAATGLVATALAAKADNDDLDTLRTQVNAIQAALIAAGLMASS